MTEEDIEHAVLECVRDRHPSLDENLRKFLLEVALRNITTKWGWHVLQWMIKCFLEKRCCLLRRVIDVNATKPSNKRKRGGSQPQSLVLPAAHFMVRYAPFLLSSRATLHVSLSHYCCLFIPLSGPRRGGIFTKGIMHWTGEQSLRRCLHQCDANVSSS